jgi:hypothetical protein
MGLTTGAGAAGGGAAVAFTGAAGAGAAVAAWRTGARAVETVRVVVFALAAVAGLAVFTVALAGAGVATASAAGSDASGAGASGVGDGVDVLGVVVLGLVVSAGACWATKGAADMARIAAIAVVATRALVVLWVMSLKRFHATVRPAIFGESGRCADGPTGARITSRCPTAPLL